MSRAKQEPELHVVGEILSGSGFDTSNAFCSYDVKTGHKSWECVGGDLSGQTQVDYPDDPSLAYVWNHPIDLHFFTKAVQGWPYVVLEVGKLDTYGGREMFGYGFCFVPNEAGCHEVDVSIWRPLGTSREEVFSFFVGGNPELVSRDTVVKKAQDDRFRLFTEAVGQVHLRLEVVLRNKSTHKFDG